jgi:hypothetical protein
LKEWKLRTGGLDRHRRAKNCGKNWFGRVVNVTAAASPIIFS